MANDGQNLEMTAGGTTAVQLTRKNSNSEDGWHGSGMVSYKRLENDEAMVAGTPIVFSDSKLPILTYAIVVNQETQNEQYRKIKIITYRRKITPGFVGWLFSQLFPVFLIAQKTLLLNFDKHTVYKLRYNTKLKFSNKGVLRRAKSMIGASDYSLKWNHSQDFVRWCCIINRKNQQCFKIPVANIGQVKDFIENFHEQEQNDSIFNIQKKAYVMVLDEVVVLKECKLLRDNEDTESKEFNFEVFQLCYCSFNNGEKKYIEIEIENSNVHGPTNKSTNQSQGENLDYLELQLESDCERKGCCYIDPCLKRSKSNRPNVRPGNSGTQVDNTCKVILPASSLQLLAFDKEPDSLESAYKTAEGLLPTCNVIFNVISTFFMVLHFLGSQVGILRIFTLAAPMFEANDNCTVEVFKNSFFWNTSKSLYFRIDLCWDRTNPDCNCRAEKIVLYVNIIYSVLGWILYLLQYLCMNHQSCCKLGTLITRRELIWKLLNVFVYVAGSLLLLFLQMYLLQMNIGGDSDFKRFLIVVPIFPIISLSYECLIPKFIRCCFCCDGSFHCKCYRNEQANATHARMRYDQEAT